MIDNVDHKHLPNIHYSNSNPRLIDMIVKHTVSCIVLRDVTLLSIMTLAQCDMKQNLSIWNKAV